MFIVDLKDALNTSITENGAEGYATSGKCLVDFNFNLASYRSKNEKCIINDFTRAWYENKELALKYLFYARDIREGAGERRLFRVCISSIVDELDERVFDWIAKFGRYDDLFVFFGTKLQEAMVEYVGKQLAKDYADMIENKPISLLAKWMPSINTSSKQTKKLAKLFIDKLESTNEEYRKILSALRKYLDVVERKMCAQQYSEINYETVPSQANLKYMDAFLIHDADRRKAYLESLDKGKVKINSSTSFPHDIVKAYRNPIFFRILEYNAALEGMWKSLPNYVNENKHIIVVRDGSASMTTTIGNTSTTALDVATALSIYFSERCEGQFKDNFITFSHRPKLVDLSCCKSLHDKLNLCSTYDEVSDTNIEATFDLILNTAIEHNLKQEEIPDLLIISDMEFNEAVDHSSLENKLFKIINDKFIDAGYNMPKLIFWNVNSRTNTIPLTENENGVILVSGFSPAIVKLVLSNELDPYKALVNELMSERYKEITLQK